MTKTPLRTIAVSAFALASALATSALADTANSALGGLSLTPAPTKAVRAEGVFKLSAATRIHVAKGDAEAKGVALQLADLSLDLIRRRVERSGQRIDLTAKEFALLELLLRRQGEVLPKTLIASQVWDMNFDSDTNIIEVAIRRLRLKVDDNFPNKLIHTVRGMGYVLEERFT